jgi:hypothetical protein
MIVSIFPRSASKKEGGEHKITIRRTASENSELVLNFGEYFKLKANIRKVTASRSIRHMPSKFVLVDLTPRNFARSNQTLG